MPKIELYDTPALALRPTETGVEARAGAGRRLGSFYNQEAGAVEGLASSEGQALRNAGRALGGGIESAGQAYVNYLDHKEVSAFSAQSTDFMKRKTDEWNAIISDPKLDPNNPKPAQDFLKGLQDDMSNLAGSDYLTTEKSRDFAEKFVERFRQHMTEKTTADLSTLAGVALKVNVQKTVNSLSSMVASDPSSRDFALDSVRHAIETKVSTAPTLDAATAKSVRAEVGLKAEMDILKSAALSEIEKTGKMPTWINDKKYEGLVNGSELQMFQKAAERQAKSDAAAARADAIQKRQQADQSMHAGSNKIITDNVSIDEQSGRPVVNPKFFKQTLDLARTNPDAPSAASTVRTMLDWAESQQNKERKAVDDPGTVKTLSDRLFDPNKPTTELDLMRAQTAGKLSDHSFQQLSRTVKELAETPLKGPIYQDTMKAVHDALVVNVPGIPGKDTVGTGKYAQFVQAFVPQYLAKFRAGTLEPNALDVSDPNSMISKSMEPFKRTPQQRMQDYLALATGMGGTGPAAPPQVSSKEDYDKLDKGTVYISAKDGRRYKKE